MAIAGLDAALDGGGAKVSLVRVFSNAGLEGIVAVFFGGFLPMPLKLNTLETAAPPEEVSMLPIPREDTSPPGALLFEDADEDVGTAGRAGTGAGEREGGGGALDEV